MERTFLSSLNHAFGLMILAGKGIVRDCLEPTPTPGPLSLSSAIRLTIHHLESHRCSVHGDRRSHSACSRGAIERPLREALTHTALIELPWDPDLVALAALQSQSAGNRTPENMGYAYAIFFIAIVYVTI